MMLVSRFASLGIATCCVINCVGCATAPYQYGRFKAPAAMEEDAVQQEEVTIAYGRPNRVADGIGYIVGFPGRLLTLHPKVNNHQFSEPSKESLVSYLQKNHLTDVYVRVNQYDPAGEWRRLRENRRIAAGWRYSVGIAQLMLYTILPGRIIGGDLYNPFTNSLYINSDVGALAVHEAAYAKDIHSRRLPGSYAAVNELPVLSLWRHVNAVNDVLGYAQTEDDWELERDTYRVVYPLMGTDAASVGGPFVSPLAAPVLHVAGALTGRAAGEWSVAQRLRNRETKEGPEIQEQAIQLAGFETTAE